MVKLPKSIKIGCRKFCIQYTNNELDELLGVCSSEDGYIKVDSVREEELPQHAIVNTLFHEVVHAIGSIYMGGVTEEETVEKITIGWLNVLRINKIPMKIDPFKIPKKLFIIDTMYTLVHPFRSVDCRGSYINSTHSIAKFMEHSDKYSTEHDFIRLVSSEILTKLESSQKFDEYMLNSLSNGLIQVFEESDMVELIRQ